MTCCPKTARKLRCWRARPSRLGQRARKVSIVEGDLNDHTALNALAADKDAFVNCAGLTMARRDEDYAHINVAGAANAARAAAASNARFIQFSSISARKPEVSPYAMSKRESETAIASESKDNAWLTLRGPAIYGPEDLVTLPFFKLVKAGIAPEPKTAESARASILFVEDAAAAIATAILEGAPREVYELGDGKSEGHEWREIGETLADVFNSRARRFRAPRYLLEAYHGAMRGYARISGAAPKVRTGQLNEFFHADWVARNNLFSDATSWRPQTSLKEGFAKTLQWYQERGWL